jgi:hypothetical protein
MTTNGRQLGLVPIEVNKLVTNKLDYHIMENINDKEETKALSQDVVIKNEVAVCPNPHCDNGIVGEVYGEKMYCNLCYEGQTVL